MTDAEIDFSDIPPLTEDFFKRATWRNRRSVPVTVKIDSVILGWFKGYGDDWERHLNVALHEYLMAHLDDERPPPSQRANTPPD